MAPRKAEWVDRQGSVKRREEDAAFRERVALLDAFTGSRFCRGGGAVREMRGIVNAEVRKSGKVGHREDFALLRIDPELVDINTVVLVPMLPSTDTDPGR